MKECTPERERQAKSDPKESQLRWRWDFLIRISSKRPKFQESWMCLGWSMKQMMRTTCSRTYPDFPACDFEALTCINASSEAKTKKLLLLSTPEQKLCWKKGLKTKTRSPDSLTTHRCLVHSVAENQWVWFLMHNFVNDSLVVIQSGICLSRRHLSFPYAVLTVSLAAARCNMATRSAKMGTAKSVFGCNGKSATKWGSALEHRNRNDGTNYLVEECWQKILDALLVNMSKCKM